MKIMCPKSRQELD